MINYRSDIRTSDQFKKDIKKSHIIEAEIAVRLAIKVHAEKGYWPDIVPCGVDFTGEIIKEDAKITSDPDFVIDGFITEITRSSRECKRVFHEKIGKVRKCIENNAVMVFVNGFEEFKQPKYVALSSSKLCELTERSKSKYGRCLQPGHNKTGVTPKEAYRYDIFWIDEQNLWSPLPVLIKGIPKKYTDFLNLVKV